MCTVIAKESASRMTVLTGIPCCLSVEHVAKSVPKVTQPCHEPNLPSFWLC
jgi:hypothetical protein